jgi:hypothetical protein
MMARGFCRKTRQSAAQGGLGMFVNDAIAIASAAAQNIALPTVKFLNILQVQRLCPQHSAYASTAQV